MDVAVDSERAAKCPGNNLLDLKHSDLAGLSAWLRAKGKTYNQDGCIWDNNYWNTEELGIITKELQENGISESDLFGNSDPCRPRHEYLEKE